MRGVQSPYHTLLIPYFGVYLNMTQSNCGIYNKLGDQKIKISLLFQSLVLSAHVLLGKLKFKVS